MLQAVFFRDIEVWAPVTLEGVKLNYYEVSTFGRVRNIKGQYLKPIQINTGYYVYSLYTGDKIDKYKRVLAHRLVLLTFSPNKDSDILTVNRENSDKSDNFAVNLEWCTQSENNDHARRTGHNLNFGTTHYRSKLTEEQVRIICEYLSIGNISYRDIIIAARLDPMEECNYDIVSNIKRGITYKSISKNYNFLH